MDAPFDRREFLKTTAGTLALLLSHQGLALAQAPAREPAAGPPVRFGLVGLGAWGCEILDALGRTESALVAGICDVYEPFLKRAAANAPKATAVTDWRRLLDAPDLNAIVIATPTPGHREIALAALQARKSVYCEAPLANSMEDARAIAAAAKNAGGVVFQAGLQGRANPLYAHVLQFVKTGVLGDVALVNAQWGRKDSWRRAAPTAERERALNWRLEKSSTGLMGEIAIHQLDLVSHYLGVRPSAIVGSGTVAAWKDGRETPDTTSCLIDFGKTRATVRATLASSFGGAYTIFQGSNSSLLLKENRGWLIKEADSPLLGWEVYARKESVHDETGIAMVADATKLLQAGKEPGKDAPLEPEKPTLVVAFESFITSIRTGSPSVCGPADAYAATVAALDANAAVVAGRRVDVRPEDYLL
ncbi:MAG TPA: Gfo/Idh/MocA family oxidoreductase [Vicinamibacterales bacterium]|nr:Gfo/Idh/MocA family oxidoreductase [Vicinamibacterales bacterium]